MRALDREESRTVESTDEPILAPVPPEDFDSFYRREHGPVTALAYVLSGSRTVAEELTQDAFVDALRRWDRLGSYENPGAWVRRAVANRAVSSYRRRLSEGRAMLRLGARRMPTVELSVETARAPSELAIVSAISDRIEPITINGRPAWLATRDSDGSRALMWMGAENQAVFVSGLAPVEELMRVAESLRVVDRATWHAAFPADLESAAEQ